MNDLNDTPGIRDLTTPSSPHYREPSRHGDPPDFTKRQEAEEPSEAVRCSELLGELGAALSLLNKARQRPIQQWSDRTNYEFIEDVMLDLSDIIESERCHSPNDSISATPREGA